MRMDIGLHMAIFKWPSTGSMCIGIALNVDNGVAGQLRNSYEPFSNYPKSPSTQL